MHSNRSHCGAHSAKHRHGYRPMQVMHRRPKYNVPVNIVNKDDRFEVHIYAVGFGKDDIKITVSEDMLHITGHKELDPNNEPKFISQEFPIKNFERTISLNNQVKTDSITADHRDSVLIIHLPKKDEAKDIVVQVK